MPESHRPRVLCFAYVAEPDRGSEHGAGWGLVRALERFSDLTVVVGPDSLPGIMRWKQENPMFSAEFVVVPEPRWLRFVPHEPHNKTRRHLWGLFIAYLAWQRKARKQGRALAAAGDFDVAFHATYSAYWLPSPAVDVGLPSVWGPIGGAVTAPASLWRALGLRGFFWEAFEWLAVRILSLGPSTRRTWRKATTALVQNEETQRRLPPDLRRRSMLLNHVMFAEIDPVEQPAEREPFILFVASFETRKGVDLALKGLARAPRDVRLIVVGDGPEKPHVMELIDELGLEDRVELRGWLPHAEVQKLYVRAAAVLFTGVREEGGFALAEAMLRGAPVIVLANGGSKTIAEAAVDADRVALAQPTNPAELSDQLGVAMTDFSHNRRQSAEPNLDVAGAEADLRHVVMKAAGR